MSKQMVKTLDGLAAGTIRSDQCSLRQIKPEEWCKGAPQSSPFHRWSNTIIKFCTICGIDKDESGQVEEETLA